MIEDEQSKMFIFSIIATISISFSVFNIISIMAIKGKLENLSNNMAYVEKTAEKANARSFENMRQYETMKVCEEYASKIADKNKNYSIYFDIENEDDSLNSEGKCYGWYWDSGSFKEFRMNKHQIKRKLIEMGER